MKVALFITCLVDQLFPNVGVSVVKVLREAGCDVVFDQRQTCCGQPAFNTGYRKEARKFAEGFIAIFEECDAEAIVTPSGSCAAMVRHFPDLFDDDKQWRKRAENIAARTYEFSDFLVNVLGKTDVGASYAGRITWHDACHALRELGLKTAPRELLSHVRKAAFREMRDCESCCGFGGTFSVKFPEISVAILDKKIAAIEDAEVDAVVSCDSSCLMQIGGRLSRLGSKVKTMHIAEILASND